MSATTYGPERRPGFIYDPATGTMIYIAPEYRIKIEKTLRSASRRFKRRLFLSYLRLQVIDFLLKGKYLALRLIYNIFRFLS